MKLPVPILVFATSAICLGQNPKPGQNFDPVQEAIREFNKNRAERQAEGRDVTVVLPPRTETADPVPAPTVESEKPEASQSLEPAKPTTEPAPEPAQAAANPAATPSGPERKPGLSVQVQKIQTGSEPIDPDQVKLLAPFAAKPLVQPPDGWRIESSAEAPPFTREVELAPGAKITLTIRPHLLSPIADGVTTFSIPEPGYDPTASYQQTKTVGAILSGSIEQLDQDSEQLDQAIDRLEQLLSSLPATAPAP